MNFAILRRPRTQALFDGTIKPAGLSTHWTPSSDPLGWGLPPHEKHRDLAGSDLDGGEMSISSFVQAKSHGAPLTALPIFLKRGLVQRSLYCLTGSTLTAAQQLVGKRIGVVHYTSSMAVWMRGILSDDYGVESSTALWFSLTGPSHHTQSLSVPDEFVAQKIPAWEELDGYAHDLDRRETFLLSLLDQGTLDAVVAFQARIDCERIRPLLHENSLGSNRLNSQIYPINHLFVVKTEIVNRFPHVVDSLLSAFRESRSLWTSYLSRSERQAFESEMAQLGYDPFAYRLDDVEKITLDVFVGHLQRENLLSRQLGLDELFYAGM